MNRLTAESTISDGYWSPYSKEEIVQRLGLYEDLGLDPVQLRKLMEKHITQDMIRKVTFK